MPIRITFILKRKLIHNILCEFGYLLVLCYYSCKHIEYKMLCALYAYMLCVKDVSTQKK